MASGRRAEGLAAAGAHSAAGGRQGRRRLPSPARPEPRRLRQAALPPEREDGGPAMAEGGGPRRAGGAAGGGFGGGGRGGGCAAAGSSALRAWAPAWGWPPRAVYSVVWSQSERTEGTKQNAALCSKAAVTGGRIVRGSENAFPRSFGLVGLYIEMMTVSSNCNG